MSRQEEDAVMVELTVEKVAMVVATEQHLLILKERQGARYLVLGIGPHEAQAIALGIHDGGLPRPMTHDLAAEILRRAHFELRSVIIHDIRDETFIAMLEVMTEFGVMEVDARPSDAVAMAVRTAAPIYCTENVMAEVGVVETDLDLGEEQE